jgi:hypothetical protein
MPFNWSISVVRPISYIAIVQPVRIRGYFLAVKSRCCGFSKSTTLSLSGCLYSEDHFVISRNVVLKAFAQFSVHSCWSWFQPFMYHFETNIGSVPIGEGPGDVAQWRGWTPLTILVFGDFSLLSFYSMFCAVLSLLFSLLLQRYITVFSIPFTY